MVDQEKTAITRKRRGPKPTGLGTLVGVRLQPDLLAWIDAERERLAPEPSRPEFIRAQIEQAKGGHRPLRPVPVMIYTMAPGKDYGLDLIHADQFLLAAQRLGGDASFAHKATSEAWTEVADAMAFLFAHALELYLKAFLKFKGVEAKTLKRNDLRHDLTRLASCCNEYGLDAPPSDLLLIEYLSPLHSSDSQYRLRYASEGTYSIAPPFQLNECVCSIRDKVKSAIAGAENENPGQREA